MSLTTALRAHSARAHIPLWVLCLRISQALLALSTLALTAFSLSRLGALHAYSLSIATAVLTLLFLLYAFLSTYRFPAASNIWALLALDAALAILWLCAFATLADCAVAFATLAGYRGYGNYSYYNGYRDRRDDDDKYRAGTYNAAVACTQAAAALAALAWVAFVATLVHSCKLDPPPPPLPNKSPCRKVGMEAHARLTRSALAVRRARRARRAAARPDAATAEGAPAQELKMEHVPGAGAGAGDGPQELNGLPGAQQPQELHGQPGAQQQQQQGPQELPGQLYAQQPPYPQELPGQPYAQQQPYPQELPQQPYAQQQQQQYPHELP